MGMSNIKINIASLDDVAVLAEMNIQLIEDEHHDNPMQLDSLVQRMKEFLLGEYNAYLFTEDESIIGYALVNKTKTPEYLRQFFIARDNRRSGRGKACFQLLLAELKVSQLDVEVMVWNEGGYRFWKSLGFEERSVYLRLDI